MRIILASASPRRRELLEQIGLKFEIRVSNVEEKTTATSPGALVEELSRQKAEAVLAEVEPDGESVLVIGADTVVALGDSILGKPGDRQKAAEMLEHLSGREHQVYTGVTLLYRPGIKEESRDKGEVSARTGAGKDAVLLETGGQESAGARAADEAEWSEDGVQESAGAGSAGETGASEGEEKAADGESNLPKVQCRIFHEMTRVHFYPMTRKDIDFYVSTGDPMDKAGAYGIQGLFARYVQGIEGDYNNVVGLPVGRLYQEAKEWLEA